MTSREVRRARKRRRRQQHQVAVALTICAAVILVLVGFRSERVGAPPREATRVKPRPVPRRPPQFVLVSFDGAGGVRLWPYWRFVARTVGAHFTFFASGVYLLDEAKRARYRPPRHGPGQSDIGFAQADRGLTAPQVVRRTLEHLSAAHREGHEIGTHYNGHFCAPYDGHVGEWTAADWRAELIEFDRLVFRAGAGLPFGRHDVVGGRTPCLEGRLKTLYGVLARRGFRYDASQVAPLGQWPRRELGIWSIPLSEIPLAGHTFDVIAMDYNLFANQTEAVSAAPWRSRAIENEAFLTFRRAFVRSYFGNRGPLSIGNHFETWNHWAYNRALARFLAGVCRLREVRCVSHRELVDWLEAQPQRRLRRARSGRFPRLKRS
jgi:hypothetical protein